MDGYLSDQAVTIVVLNNVVAGTGNQNSASVNLAAYPGVDAVRFIASIGALTSTQVTNMLLQGSNDNSTWVNITGAVTANMADGNSNTTLIIDLMRPSVKYVRAVVSRATANAVINVVLAELYKLKNEQSVQDASVTNYTRVAPSL